MCFKGKHLIALDEKAYAVIAQRSSDPERSNWSGKTAFFEAMRFCLTGWLNKDRGAGAQGWITDGEKEGGVRITLSDTTVIHRSRKRTTELLVQLPTGEQLKGEEAQLAIDKAIGLDATDFPVTCYFQQRQMARIILDDPSARMKYVSAWIRLEPLERAEASVAEEVGKLIAKLDPIRSRATMLEQEVARVSPSTEEISAIQAERLEAERRFGAMQEEHAKALEAERAQDLVGRYKTLIGEGSGLKLEIDQVDTRALEVAHDVAEAALKLVEAEIAVAAQDVAEKRLRVLGDFDGRCPVADFVCPARAAVDASKDGTKRLFDGAVQVSAAARAKLDAAKGAERAARVTLIAQQKKIEQLDSIRAQAQKLQPAYKVAKGYAPPPSFEELNGKFQAARAELQEVIERETKVKMAIDMIKRQEGEHEKLLALVATIETQLATYREAAAIFGKQGAQRRVAEAALLEIETAANQSLSECGIELQVEVRWARAGSELAKACDACGKPFPTSAKVKACDRCGAARGPNYVNKLEIVLTDQSGAAEDLAGATIQLAASAWLRADRESQWSTAFIDEPFGQLDAANRRVFAGHLATLLGSRYGFSQAFVIAHHSSVLDALPGRILIENDGTHSTIRVVC